MPDATAEFFAALGSRGHDPRLRKASGSIRFDIVNGKRTERWLVTLDKGDVGISRRNARADAVVTAERALFNRVASGETNVVAALLCEELDVEGNVNLLVLFRRLLPAPPRSRRRPPSAAARRKS
jgi:alkyl sulfatase BDS1-like metallo-beta-lactamase superfamily hydrolase